MQLLLALGLWPLIVFAAASIVLLAFLEHDNEGAATLAALGGTVLILWLTRANPLPWLQAHTGAALLGLVGYFVVGALYSLVKWYFFLLDLRDEQRERSEAFGRRLSRPKVAEHKARITGWMTYWPWSAIWFVLSGPVKRTWRFLYARMAAVFQRIADHVFRDVPVEP
jgi:hypothetical protein